MMGIYKLQIFGSRPETRIFDNRENATRYAEKQTGAVGGIELGNDTFVASDEVGDKWRLEPFHWPSTISRKNGMVVNLNRKSQKVKDG